MAFIGTPVVELVSDRKVRVTGVQLAPGTSGTISLAAGSGEVTLPAQFQPAVYESDIGPVSLQASIEVSVWEADLNGPIVSPPINIVKTGTTPQNFLATIKNTADNTGPTSGLLEIYIQFH